MPTLEPFPDHLHSARLELRRYGAADVQGLLRLIERNRERLIRNFPELARGLNSAGEAAAYIDASDHQRSDGRAFVYGIWAPGESTPIGQLRVKNIVWSVPSAELSYFVDRDWLRKGIATEAVRAVLREAFEMRGWKRLYVRVIAGNQESLALARRLRLRHEGVNRNAFRCGFGKLHDVHLFAMTDSDYHCGSRSDTMSATDISRQPIHLGRGATAVTEPAFTGNLEWYQDYSARHAADGTEGRLVSMFTFSEPWSMWEMHPNGSEVVLCTSGALTLHQETAAGTRRTVTLHPGQYAINEPGTWHTADVQGPATALFITAGWGTQHRPR